MRLCITLSSLTTLCTTSRQWNKHFTYKSHGLSRAKPEPSPGWRLWLGLGFEKAKAGAFRPSWAGTSLSTEACNSSCILLEFPPNQCVTLMSILSHSTSLLFDSICEPTMLVLSHCWVCHWACWFLCCSNTGWQRDQLVIPRFHYCSGHRWHCEQYNGIDCGGEAGLCSTVDGHWTTDGLPAIHAEEDQSGPFWPTV